MDILDRIRNTTVADLESVSGDFSDVAPEVYRPRVAKNMQRIVKGATDLSDAHAGHPAPRNPGMVRTDGTGTIDTRPFRGEPTEAQRGYMGSLMTQLAELDHTTWLAGVKYMEDMDSHNAWNPARGENASRWIDRLKAKVAELKERPASVGPAPLPVIDGQLPVKNDKNGKPMALYYAIGTDVDAKFYRIKPGYKPGFYFVDIQASDQLHSIRNAATKAQIIRDILDAGAEQSMARYGQLIGRCGRCNLTLTDPESRARGIGPDCWEKM